VCTQCDASYLCSLSIPFSSMNADLAPISAGIVPDRADELVAPVIVAPATSEQVGRVVEFFERVTRQRLNSPNTVTDQSLGEAAKFLHKVIM
jgi:hypothetical protein